LASMMFLLLFVRFAKNVLHFAKLEPRQKPK